MGKQVNVQNSVLMVRTRFFDEVNETIVMRLKGKDDRVFVERKHGEWIKKTDGLLHLVTIIWFVCSSCGEHQSQETPFCPWCGADMKKEGGNK